MTFSLATVKLTPGDHQPNGQACVMEAVSQVAGEEWSDCPSCTDHALAAFCRVINDQSPQWVRDALKERIPAIAKARKLPENWRWVWPEFARQMAVLAIGPVRGKKLAACRPVVDEETCEAMRTTACAYADNAAAYAAADAARVDDKVAWNAALVLIDRACREAMA